MVNRWFAEAFLDSSRALAATSVWVNSDELTMTTNGTQLARYAPALFDAGVRRINVSLDTLDASRFRAITRTGNLDAVLRGIFAAQCAGLRIKINMVALRATNDDEFDRMIRWCGDKGFDLTFIETMPLGAIDELALQPVFAPIEGSRRFANALDL